MGPAGPLSALREQGGPWEGWTAPSLAPDSHGLAVSLVSLGHVRSVPEGLRQTCRAPFLMSPHPGVLSVGTGPRLQQAEGRVGVLLRGPKGEGTAPGDAGDNRATTKGHMQKPAGDSVLEGLSEQEPRESRDRRQLPPPGGLRAPSSEPLCQQGTWGPRAAAEL